MNKRPEINFLDYIGLEYLLRKLKINIDIYIDTTLKQLNGKIPESFKNFEFPFENNSVNKSLLEFGDIVAITEFD